MQIVVNKTTRPLIVAKPIHESVEGVKQFEPVRLMPGANEVDEATAKAINSSATAKLWIDKGYIDLPVASSKGESIAGYDDETALQLVADCFDIAVLDAWIEVDKRKNVRTAIKARGRQLAAALARNDQKEGQ